MIEPTWMVEVGIGLTWLVVASPLTRTQLPSQLVVVEIPAGGKVEL
jgi:hypothetical protein